MNARWRRSLWVCASSAKIPEVARGLAFVSATTGHGPSPYAGVFAIHVLLLTAARAELVITIPPAVLARADEIIQ